MSDGVILSKNSRNAALGVSEEWVGEQQMVSRFDSVCLAGLTDQNGTVFAEFSVDGVNWDSSLSFQVTANQGFLHRLTVMRSRFRCRFVNGAVAQSFLRVECLAGPKTLITSSLGLMVPAYSDSIVTKSLQADLLIPFGLLGGWSSNTKFGENLDADTGSVPEDVWDVGGNYTGFPTGSAETIEVFSGSADDTSAGTGARTVRLEGLDGNFVYQTEDVALNGTTAVATTATWSRMSRMYVLTAGSGEANAGVITARHTSTTANVFATIPIGDNQTLVCATTVPAGETMLIRRVSAQIARNNNGANAEISIRAREPGGVFRKRRKYSTSESGIDRHYEAGLVLPSMTDVKLTIEDVSANNTAVFGSFEYFTVTN